MQCTWQNSARRLAFASHRAFSLSLNERHSLSFPDVDSSHPTSSSLTPAQRGRAASQAISFALCDGNLADAYHIVNSIRLANSQSAFSFSVESTTNATSACHFQLVANAFTPGVSPRLPSHTLLHELIRRRSAYQASLLAEQMMSSGMKVRTRSLEVLFTALAQTSSPTPSTPSFPSSETSSSVLLAKNSMSRGLSIHPELISDTSTRFAVRLLLLARQSRQRRTHRMFKALMALCLINGEIILASLLFGILVRDWQQRVQLGQLKEEESDGQVVNPNGAMRLAVIYDTPFPAWSHLNGICAYIDESCPHPASLPDADSETVLRYTASLQALANLAHLLDRRMLPIGGLTGLLQTMYKCPSGDTKVWVWEKKKKKGEGGEDDKQLEAHVYFKNVLKRLADRLPRPSTSSSSSLRESAPAPLTLQTYNTLLHYSLAHSRSRWMADKILHHMLYIHEGMEPNVVTMNILERAAMRSRHKDINKGWVDEWRKRASESSRSQNAGSSENDGKKRGTEVMNGISSAVLELHDIAARYTHTHAEHVTVNDSDNHTLSTRIAYLVACGRPDIVVNSLPALMPGISSLRMQAPTLDPIPSTTTMDDSAVRRAVAYGPVVLTSILSALMKTGRTGLAEKVWEIMKEAEHLSWVLFSQTADKGEEKVSSPWCLGIEAYTVMIKVYGKEARKGAGYGHDHRRFDRGVDTGKYMVVGWGRNSQGARNSHKKRRGRRKKISRVQLGRYMGMKIYRTALKQEAITRFKFDLLCSELKKDGSVRMRVVKNQLRLPRPDAYFFNAILDIVARRPGMTPRSRASWTRRKARSRFIAKQKKYVWEGRVMGLTEPDGRLKEVVGDIRRFGFQVPLLVRRILVGRDEDVDGFERGKESSRVWLKVKAK